MAKKKKNDKKEVIEEEEKAADKKGAKKGKKKLGWKEQMEADEAEAKIKKEQEEAFNNRPPKFIVARHILVTDQEKAQEIYDQIFEEHKDQPPPGAFGKLAKEHSECDSKSKGGKLKAFGKDKMAIEFEEAAFETKPGKMTKPIKTEFGYHIILVEEHNK